MSSDELRELRRKMANIDYRIIDTIAERMDIARQIGKVKLRKGIPIEVESVEEKVMERALERANEKNIETDLVRDLFGLLLEYSKKRQGSENYAPDSDSGT